ncbi:unnamed protein product [Heligmosomoides polygyrus]|uniref:Glucuronosyltransferase n=1 Tax=Heligmosomoides polygyrus TaxID=6339 RepID=A0A183F6J7_HELPZ|nr:unnamed protein product [Heligmosomoides polygyrus]
MSMPELVTLILLLAGFEGMESAVTREHQKTYVYGVPAQIRPEWLREELSAIVLFTPTIVAPAADWEIPWLNIITAVAEGADLYVLPGPQDSAASEAGVALLRGLVGETLAQRPCLRGRIISLFPSPSRREVAQLPQQVLKSRNGNDEPHYTPSQAKRFFNENVKFLPHNFTYCRSRETARSRTRSFAE